MLNEAVKAKYLIPIKMESTIVMDGNKGYGDVEDANINFELLKANTGKIYYPVFTDLKELQKCAVDKNQSSMVVGFDDLAALLLQPMNAIAAEAATSAQRGRRRRNGSGRGAVTAATSLSAKSSGRLWFRLAPWLIAVHQRANSAFSASK